jgi:hypothetical protein
VFRAKLQKTGLILKNVVIKIRDKPIRLVLKPYLIAKDRIQVRMEKRGAGLKMPVTLKIKDMPKMLDFAVKHNDAEPA